MCHYLLIHTLSIRNDHVLSRFMAPQTLLKSLYCMTHALHSDFPEATIIARLLPLESGSQVMTYVLMLNVNNVQLFFSSVKWKDAPLFVWPEALAHQRGNSALRKYAIKKWRLIGATWHPFHSFWPIGPTSCGAKTSLPLIMAIGLLTV